MPCGGGRWTMRNVQRWRRRRRPVAMTAALIVVVVVGLDRRGVTAGAVCRGDTCNDGGCSYAAAANGSAVRCDCNRVSAGLRVGADCGSYADACSDNTFRPCLNGGTCVSALGFAYCDCPAGYGGTHEQCEHRQTGSETIKYPRKPSLYYRTKVRPGEIIKTLFVIEYDDAFRFTLRFNNDAVGTFTFYENKSSMTPKQFYSVCMSMGSNDFPVNKNMCNFVKSAYGNSKITVLEALPYYMSKTRNHRTDVYFNGKKSDGRMGGLYPIKAIIFDENTVKPLMWYNFNHLVVDDESSYCLPFVDPGKNCKVSAPGLEVKRSENVPVIKMIITEDTEMCNTSMKYTYEWKVADSTVIPNYFTDSDGSGSLKVIDLDRKTLRDRDLTIRQYTLPEGYLLVKFKLTVNDRADRSKQYSDNRYMCSLHVSVDGLRAAIVGGPVRQVSNSDLVTLDASSSVNPNEPGNRQDDVLYTWNCDVPADQENCRTYTTSNPVRKLSGLLDKAEKYVFTLITRVNDEYGKRVGKPKEGTANITVLPTSFIIDIRIKCIKNCGQLSSPLEIVYLLVETKCENCSFEWYYKEENNSAFISAKSIRKPNTPDYVFIATKRSLGYDKTYTFKVIDSASELENSIIIRTAAEPVAGECHVNPKSGIAGTTLFNVTCLEFHDVYGDEALSYYYYERYESDQDELGVLIDRGSNNLNNIKLSTLGKLNILAINSFGVYARVDTSIKILKSNTSELVKMFKMMKIEFLNGNIPATVQMLSAICDILHDNKVTDGFSVLFKTISKIPTKGCSFCIEQTVSAVKKVMLMCSAANGHKIKPEDALQASSTLLLTARDLFEYLKTLRSVDVINEVERIERIYDNLKVVVDVLIRDVDPVFHENNTTNSTRYVWSSLEKMVLATENIAETLKAFGESIVLHHFIFEKNITYTSKESSFWANMLNDEMLRKRNDTISDDLANELSSNKIATWGFKIFEVDKKLALWAGSGRPSGSVESIVKYVALSVHNHNADKTYLGLINEFVSPASITFNITETVQDTYRHDKKYKIRIPAVGSATVEFDKAIIVFRLDMTEVGAIFTAIKRPTHDLLVAWTRDRRPDFELMTDERYTHKVPAQVDSDLAFQTRKDFRNDVHYIGIFADVTNNGSSNRRPDEVKFNMNLLCMQCVSWNGFSWSAEGTEIGSDSAAAGGNVHCFTNHFSLFKSSIFVVPELLNPIEEIHLFSTIADNMVCLILVAIIFVLYFLALFWSRVQDKKDMLMGRIIILDDNYVGEDEVYLVVVYTGHWLGSGTTANVCIELNGTVGNGRAHWLYSPNYRTLQRSNDDWFLVFTPQSLGEIQSVHMWHDNYGPHPDWYCTRVLVTEIRRGKCWSFNVNRWFSLYWPDERIEHTVPHVESAAHDWTKETREYVGTGIREKHMWASVVIRHPRSPITRCQRLSVILCAVLSTMLASMIFYELRTNEEEFEKFELKSREFIIALESAVVETLIRLSVNAFFQLGRSVQLNKMTYTTLGKNTIIQDDELHQQSKTYKFIMKFMVENKNIYYPVVIGAATERNEWNYWFTIGWIWCIVIYILTGFYIILYGLKFGHIKSLCWLASITIGILQGAMVFKPFNIIMISAILAKYGWKAKDPFTNSTYNLTLHRYREKTRTLLQNVKYTRAVRKNRKRYLYTPIIGEAIDVLRDRRRHTADRRDLMTDAIVCSVLISVSLCCLYALTGFGDEQGKYHANRIASGYVLERVFASRSSGRTMTLHDLKKSLSSGLLTALHALELYNGAPVGAGATNKTAAERTTTMGWFGLYNSRLIGGGIMLTQERAGSNDWSYGSGWTKRNETAVGNSYTTTRDFSKSNVQSSFFFKSSATKAEKTGYELLLAGGPMESRSTLDEHLRSGWLDAGTRRLYVDFQMYTPDTDWVTVVQVLVASDCGLRYTVSANTIVTWTVPASSVVTGWATYAFTVVAACSLTAAAIACLLALAFRRTGHDGTRWTSAAFDALLIVLAVAASVALRQRLTAMEQASEGLVAGGYVRLAPACRAHDVCVRCAAALAAAAILKLSRTWWWTPDAAATIQLPSRVVLAVAAVAVGGLVGYRAAAGPLLAAGLVAFLLFCAAAVRRTTSS